MFFDLRFLPGYAFAAWLLWCCRPTKRRLAKLTAYPLLTMHLDVIEVWEFRFL
jgi:hypothetical protein